MIPIASRQYRDLSEIEVSWSELKRVRRRQHKETLREVYLQYGRFVFKRYIICRKKRYYPKPWVAEANALIRARGCRVPEYIATYRGVRPDQGPEFVLQRTYIPGTSLKSLSDEHVGKMAGMLAALHRRKVITRDAHPDNFLMGEDGKIRFVDLGKARTHRRKTIFYYYDIGSELARFMHATLHYHEPFWQVFLQTYYQVKPSGPAERAIEQFFYRFCRNNRLRRRSLRLEDVVHKS